MTASPPRGAAAVIRPVAPCDRDGLEGMWEAAFEAKGAGLVRSLSRLRTEVRSWVGLLLDDPHRFGFAAETGGALAGFVAARLDSHPWLNPPWSGVVGAIWVEPSARRAGLGRGLAERALAEFAARGVDNASVTVIISSPHALAFWRALGFSDHALHMRRGT